jgi:hypothetical protein
VSIRNWVIIGIAWVVSLAGVAVTVSAQAQARMYRPLPEPKLLFGADVGFRVEGMYGEVPTGTVVINVNGRWVEARLGGGIGVSR